MHKTQLSVIINVFNVAPYLERCLASVSASSQTGLEFLIIDDGSTDLSPKIYQGFAERDTRFRIITKKNGGLPAARQTGIDAAHGDYITFVDGDDFIAPEMFAHMVSALDGSSVDMAFFNSYYAHHPESTHLVPTPFIGTYHDISTIIRQTINYDSPRRAFFSGVTGKVFRLSHLRQHQVSYDTTLVTIGDTSFVLRYLMHSREALGLPGAYYYYVVRPGSNSRQSHAFEVKWSHYERYLTTLLGDLERTGNTTLIRHGHGEYLHCMWSTMLFAARQAQGQRSAITRRMEALLRRHSFREALHTVPREHYLPLMHFRYWVLRASRPEAFFLLEWLRRFGKRIRPLRSLLSQLGRPRKFLPSDPPSS